jgi:hypothetical protein
MIGPTIVFAIAVALVAGYIFLVNRSLRTDENWSESNQARPESKRSNSAVPFGRLTPA